jgi:hypothetical protein
MAGDDLTLRPDPRNPNLGTAEGRAIIRESLQRHKPGRSGVAAKDGTMLGGNQTLKEIQAAGIPIRTVHTTGDEWVVVVRDDLDPNSVEAGELAVADNTAAHKGYNLDPTQVDALLSHGANFSGLLDSAELDSLLARAPLSLSPDNAPVVPAAPAPAVAAADGQAVPSWAQRVDTVEPPAHPPAESYIKMAQLFLTTETHPLFLELVEALMPVLNRNNPTDTVMEALRYAHDHLVGAESDG